MAEPTNSGAFVASANFGRRDGTGNSMTEGTLEVALAAARQDLARGAQLVRIIPRPRTADSLTEVCNQRARAYPHAR